MSVTRLVFCLALGPILLTVCSNSQLAGPSTEQGNPQVVAIVVDNHKQPIGNVTVSMYRVSTIDDASMQPTSAVNIAVRRTDVLGKCSFDNVSAGLYSLEASDNANNRSSLTKNIVISTVEPIRSGLPDTIVLDNPGSIQGVVSRGGVPGNLSNQNLRDAFIQVVIGEIDRSTVTGPDGKYSFENLPSGSFTFYFYAADGFYTSKKEDIKVLPGADLILDTVLLRPVPRLLPPRGLSAVQDTVAGMVRLRWQKVVFDSLRWYEVERVNLTAAQNIVFICNDTLFSDTVAGLPTGTILDYVVRSVDRAFNRSSNAGPVEIMINNQP